MIDIVGRLWSCGIKDKVVIDAANQIEFLRQRVQELEDQITEVPTIMRQLQACQVREAKLREALKLLMSAPFDYPDDEYQQDALASAMSNANTLLNQKQDDSALQKALKQARKEALLEVADQIRIDADVQGSIERHIKMWLRKIAEEQK